MTLLVAAIDGENVWMIADTTLTGGDIQNRERRYMPKIECGHEPCLIGFAGDSHHGSRIIREAASRPAGTSTVDFLLEKHLEIPSVDFAYCYYEDTRPRLVRIANRQACDVITLYLGDTTAFSNFQANRHEHLEHAPKAMHTFLLDAGASDTESFSDAVCAMLLTIFNGKNPTVGGWAVPYILTPQGTHLCGYAYSVTDPIINNLALGTATTRNGRSRRLWHFVYCLTGKKWDGHILAATTGRLGTN